MKALLRRKPLSILAPCPLHATMLIHTAAMLPILCSVCTYYPYASDSSPILPKYKGSGLTNLFTKLPP